MVPEFGTFALILAFSLAIIQGILPTLGVIKNNPVWMGVARPIAYGQLLFVAISFLCLMYAFVSNDFSVAYVAQNSNSQLPLMYRISAVWGGHEGSLLLWILLLSVWSAAVARFSRSLPQEMITRVLVVLGLIGVGFLWFILQTSNPFQRLLPNIPVDGLDLNPLLQDPGLIIHPPMLYMGYVGFSVAFAFAIAALWSGRLDAAWARWSRPWTLVAWLFLTFGITLGSWWAYNELGWGGWWFWDPVENASFLPWLVGTALIHSLAVTEKRGVFKGWTVLLAISAFSLSLLGTFLVRSGVLTSVHAFASDPERGAFLLKYLLVVVGSALVLYLFRAPAVRSEGRFSLLSRESLLLSNNILLMVAAATVLLGTLYPLILDGMGLGKISVGPPYFNSVFIPLMTPLLFFMGMGPSSFWQKMEIRLLWQRLRYTLAVSITLGFVLPWVFTGGIQAHVVLGLVLAFWVTLGCLQDTLARADKRQGNLWQGLKQLSRSQYGMVVAHLGVATCVLAVSLTTAYSVERDVRMLPGDQAQIGPYEFTFEGTKPLNGPNYNGIDGQFRVTKQGEYLSTLNAEKRFYRVQGMAMTEAAVDINFFNDLYVALGEPIDKAAWAVRLYYKPFVRWIWAGGLLMMLGGLLAATDKRYRLLAKKARQANADAVAKG